MTLSVLMSVYDKDSPAHLDQALKSLSVQTVLPSEVVLVEDGPISDELTGVIEKYRSELAIKSVRMAENQGLGAALNEGLKHCKNELIARMDSDDISLPMRFEKQIAFMKSNPEVAVSSAWIEERDHAMETVMGIRCVPSSHGDVLRYGRRRNPINHVASIFRKNDVMKVGGYPNIRKAQDYALWSLMLIEGFRFANIPETLLYVRAGDALMTRRGLGYLRQEIKLLRFQRSCGFLSRCDYCINLVIRVCVRLQPSLIKRLMYRYSRGQHQDSKPFNCGDKGRIS